MSCKINTCATGAIENLGVPTCVPQISAMKMAIFTPYFDKNGEINSIDLTTFTGSKAEFDAKLNDTIDKRWQPLSNLKEVVDEKGDPAYKTYSDDSTYFTQEGKRKITFIIPTSNVLLVNKINAMRCVEVGFYAVTVDGDLKFHFDETNNLALPFKIESQSIYAKLIPAKDKDITQIQVTFTLADTEDDGDMRIIECSEMTDDIRSIRGLLDADVKYSLQSSTNFNMNLFVNTIKAKLPDPIEGIKKEDVTLMDNGTPVAITTLTEVSEGNYNVEFEALAPGTHNIIVTVVKNGYDFSRVVAKPCQIIVI